MPPNLSEVRPNLKKISSNCHQRTRIIKQFDYMFNANRRSHKHNPTANHRHNNRLASTNFLSIWSYQGSFGSSAFAFLWHILVGESHASANVHAAKFRDLVTNRLGERSSKMCFIATDPKVKTSCFLPPEIF